MNNKSTYVAWNSNGHQIHPARWLVSSLGWTLVGSGSRSKTLLDRSDLDSSGSSMRGTAKYQALFHEATRVTPERLLELLDHETSAEIHRPDGSIQTVQWDRAVDLLEAGEPVIWRFGLKGFFRSKFPEHVLQTTDDLLIVEMDGHTFRFERLVGGWRGVSKEDCLAFDRQIFGDLVNVKLRAYDSLDEHLS